MRGRHKLICSEVLVNSWRLKLASMKLHSNLRIILSALLLITVTSQFNGCSSSEEDPDAPKIISISPESGPPGTIVTITGQGFDEDGMDNYVEFNGVAGIVIPGGNSTFCTIPAPKSTTGPVTLKVKGVTLIGPIFTYTAPVVTKDYFFKFKADGKEIIYETGNPGFSGCGDCSCSTLPPLEDENASLDVCFGDVWDVTAEMINALKNKTLKFDESLPAPTFSFDLDGVWYTSDEVSQASTAKVTITDVIADGSYYEGYDAFKVKGTLTCKVADSDGNVINITDATFSVRFTEGL